jgi:hypothetical protein
MVHDTLQSAAMQRPSSRGHAGPLAGTPPNRRHRRFQSSSLGDTHRQTKCTEKLGMLYTIAIVLVVLWLLGLVTSYTMGGFVHVLLVLAVIMILVQVLQGRRI